MIRFDSEKGLARYLEVPHVTLVGLAANAVREYEPFIDRKGKKPRPIDNPSGHLKAVQRKIYRRLLKGFNLPNYIHGGVEGRDTNSNARAHLARPCLVRIDIRSFFPNVTHKQVYEVWAELLNHGPDVARLLTQLTTFRGRLPQGAPSSTALANLVLLDADRQIVEGCQGNGIELIRFNYSRYVDDLHFSGENVRDLIQGVVQTLGDAGFPVSRSKISIVASDQPQEVTGLSVNFPSGPSVLRRKRDAVRRRIHSIGDMPEGKKRERALLSCRGSIVHIGHTTDLPRFRGQFS